MPHLKRWHVTWRSETELFLLNAVSFVKKFVAGWRASVSRRLARPKVSLLPIYGTQVRPTQAEGPVRGLFVEQTSLNTVYIV